MKKEATIEDVMDATMKLVARYVAAAGFDENRPEVVAAYIELHDAAKDLARAAGRFIGRAKTVEKLNREEK